MKILHVGKYFPPYAGGMETYLRDLMAAQARQGLDTAALVHQSDIGFNSQHERYQAGEQQLSVTRAAVWARFLFTPISLIFPWLLNRLIQQKKPDILHLHMPNVSVFWALLLPSARKTPWVVHWHADVLASEHSVGLRLFYRLYKPFEGGILRHAKAIVATSPPYLASSKPLAAHCEKCHTIPLGLDPSKLMVAANVKTPEHEQGSPQPRLRVLAIGRLTYYKGFEFLIRAAADVDNIDVYLVGRGDEESRLKALCTELGLAGRVHFLGQLSDQQLAEQFATCDCLCLPSIERTEALGMVLLEAMYCRKVTLVSDVSGSGMGWVVDEGRTGLKLPPENTRALSDALQNLEQNRDKVKTLGEGGRQRFDQLFHIDQSAADIADLYRQVRVVCSAQF